MQYGVQVDVVTQLEARVKQQLNSGGQASSNAPQIVKLKRDFERVQARVQSLKLDVDRMERLAKTTTGSSGYYNSGTSSSATTQNQSNAAALQQMQMQMQQDVSSGIFVV